MDKEIHRKNLASAAVTIINNTIGEDADREGLLETPRRFAEAWQFWTKGYSEDPAKYLKTFDGEGHNELIFQGGISVWALCEHHLAPFFGVCHIGYIPQGRIVGLSKFSRLVDVYIRRLTIQERATNQIAEIINTILNPTAVGVVMRCRHSCLEARGVQKAGTITYTSALRGAFKTNISARSEFLRFVERADTDCRL